MAIGERNTVGLVFLRPYWLLCLPIIFTLFILLWRTKLSESKIFHQICDPHLLKYLLVDFGKVSYKKQYFLILLALSWFLTIFILAGPSWKSLESIPDTKALLPAVILLDVSNHMLARDVQPNRLKQAKYQIQDLLNQKSNTHSIGLIAFAKEPYIASPLTEDKNNLLALLPELDPEMMPVQGQNIGWALKKGAELIQQTGYSSGELILMTPGPITKKDQNIAKKLASKGFSISTIKIGTEEGAPIKNKYGNIILSQLDQTGLNSLHQLNSSKTNKMLLQQDQGYLFVLLLLPFGFLAVYLYLLI